MDISLGFVVILTLVLFPGLIFRRLYFYGEFSKQFNTNNNLIRLIAVSAIPGVIVLITVYFYYNFFFTEINLDQIIDKFKEINNPTQFSIDQIAQEKEIKENLNELITEEVFPFFGFLYTISIILGAISGRFVRITRIDTKFKLLRFKNYWFYLLSAEHTGFKKMKHLKRRNSKHVFTKADILIDSGGKTSLYSGIVVDYELEDNNCTILSKVMLQNAERYSLKGDKIEPVPIPGTLFIVDCSTMKNINLTYIYEEQKSILKSRIPNIVDIIFSLFFIFLIPIFIFQAENVEWKLYKYYFTLNWFPKIVIYLISVQFLSLLNPFLKKKDEYQWISMKSLFAKIVWIGIFVLLFWVFSLG